MTRASTTRLAPGEHSIDRVTPRKRPDGVWVLDWSVRLHDGKRLDKRTQGSTKGQVRARAKAKAADLLATGNSSWSRTSLITDYIDQVSKPAIDSARLRPGSAARYHLVLGHLRTELKGYSIGDAVKFRTLERALMSIGAGHGAQTAKQARTVLSKYVLQQLIRDQVIDHSPISGMSIDLGTVKKSAKPAGGRALTRDEYNTVLEWFLDLDPAEGSARRSVTKRRNVRDLTLIQAATGLRIGEVRTLEWSEVSVDDQGQMSLTVTAEKSKTHKSRTVPVLDDRVAEVVLTRKNTVGGRYVVGAPTDPNREWDKMNCQRAVAALYQECAAATGVTLLATSRSHLWRATLNSLMLDLPEVVRAAYFGHDAEVNRSSYTDVTDTSAMVTAARKLRSVG
jgi:integrase